MEGQGENIAPNGTNNQVPSTGMPPDSSNYNGGMQSNNAPYLTGPQLSSDASTTNVAQHVLGDINNLQPTPTPVDSTATTAPTDSWTMPGSTTISSADVPNPEFTPESIPGETARIHAALSHPYFSNHPTQTSASGVGDIVIDNRPVKQNRKSKTTSLSRGKVIGIVMAVVAVVFIIVLAVVSIKSESDLSTLLPTYENSVSNIEGLLPMTDYNTISFRRFFNTEQHNQLNLDIESYLVFQQKLSKVNEKNLTGEQVELFRKLQEVVNHNAPLLQRFLEQYNTIYTALQENNTPYFTELASAENKELSFIGKRMMDYYDSTQYWETYIQDNGCDNLTDAEMIEPCEQARNYLERNRETIDGGTSIVRALGDYIPDIRGGVQEIIDELLGEKK